MPKLPPGPESDRKARRTHDSLKWLLSLLSAVITTGLVVLLSQQF